LSYRPRRYGAGGVAQVPGCFSRIAILVNAGLIGPETPANSTTCATFRLLSHQFSEFGRSSLRRIRPTLCEPAPTGGSFIQRLALSPC